MSRPPDHMYQVSERLSEVMDDIGVNGRLVKKRWRAWMLMQNIMTIVKNQIGSTGFILGSQIEGSTTLGLQSDLDTLIAFDTVVIQNMSEWKPEVVNLLMIQNENISPGYCHLQCINDIESRMMEHCDADSEGRLLLKNTSLALPLLGSFRPSNMQTKLHGPALTMYGISVFSAHDIVASYYCESLTHQVTSWLQKQRGRKWPTEDVLEKCRNVGCFVVPVGSKESSTPELEWRISTNLQERVLMFSLYITQLRCYILMKMILQTYIHPHVEGVLTSFMCKNVLFHCIANSSHDWHTGNLLSYLHLCLDRLKECVEQRNCPHVIIPENNLLAGRMTDTQRGKLLDIINNLMGNDAQFLYEIQIDDLGRRLKMKLNMILHSPNIAPATFISYLISRQLVHLTAGFVSTYLLDVLEKIKHESTEIALPYLFLVFTNLERHSREYNLQTASELLIPLVSSTLGSVLASSNIASHTAISDQAFTYLEAGKESDALSGRLKLVSVLYCTGDMERAERELRISQKRFKLPLLDATCKCNDGSACRCYAKALSYRMFDTDKACDDYNEAAIKSHISFIPIFLKCEINCVPHELRYEILKSYIQDRPMFTDEVTGWMDFMNVDSVPYLYFLQYKIYGRLQRRAEQRLALSELAQSIDFDHYLIHRDTALNLLGQCFEQENRHTEAFQCYIWSLKHRARNNAARFLLCIQLFKIWKQDKTQ